MPKQPTSWEHTDSLWVEHQLVLQNITGPLNICKQSRCTSHSISALAFAKSCTNISQKIHTLETPLAKDIKHTLHGFKYIRTTQKVIIRTLCIITRWPIYIQSHLKEPHHQQANFWIQWTRIQIRNKMLSVSFNIPREFIQNFSSKTPKSDWNGSTKHNLHCLQDHLLQILWIKKQHNS